MNRPDRFRLKVLLQVDEKRVEFLLANNAGMTLEYCSAVEMDLNTALQVRDQLKSAAVEVQLLQIEDDRP